MLLFDGVGLSLWWMITNITKTSWNCVITPDYFNSQCFFQKLLDSDLVYCKNSKMEIFFLDNRIVSFSFIYLCQRKVRLTNMKVFGNMQCFRRIIIPSISLWSTAFQTESSSKTFYEFYLRYIVSLILCTFILRLMPSFLTLSS